MAERLGTEGGREGASGGTAQLVCRYPVRPPARCCFYCVAMRLEAAAAAAGATKAEESSSTFEASWQQEDNGQIYLRQQG